MTVSDYPISVHTSISVYWVFPSGGTPMSSMSPPKNGNIKATTIEITKVGSMRLQLHDAIHRPDSFALMLRYCVNLKVIR